MPYLLVHRGFLNLEKAEQNLKMYLKSAMILVLILIAVDMGFARVAISKGNHSPKLHQIVLYLKII